MISMFKKADYTNVFSLERKAVVQLTGVGQPVLEALKKVGYEYNAGISNVTVKAVKEDSRRLCFIEETRRISDEKYALYIEKTTGGADITIYYAADRGLFYGILAVNAMLEENLLPTGDIIDYPLFPVRGYIEGFYGKPWRYEQRLDMIDVMAKNRMNTCYYGPKDDDYHRELWRDLYPEQELMRLTELNREATDLFMDFYYCIAPGLSMKYSDENEFAALMNKTKQLYDAGVRNFGLLLDDISDHLKFDEDKAQYGETVNAHIDLIGMYFNALQKISSDIKLTVCPTLYFGKGDEYYIAKLGLGIDTSISVFWTGRDVCSRELTSPEAVRFIESTRHKPLYWDNYPVNDGDLYNEMHIGPIIGRDKDLYKYSEGIISNCMEYAECSKIPLITVADFLWDSEQYNPTQSWNKALVQIVGAENAQDFATFADHLFISCLKDENSKLMQNLFTEVERDFNAGNIGDALEKVSGYIEKMNKCNEFLKSGAPLCIELTKWADKFSVLCEMVNKLLELVMSNDEELKDELFELIDCYESKQAVMTKMNMKQEIASLLNTPLLG